MPATPIEQRIGLRFRKSQARILRNLVARMKSEGIDREHISLFEAAADAAYTGEPLIVVCHELMEAELMAAAFPKWGVVAPTIEQLSVV